MPLHRKEANQSCAPCNDGITIRILVRGFRQHTSQCAACNIVDGPSRRTSNSASGSAGKFGPVGAKRRPPVDTFQEIAQLRGRDAHRVTDRLWPDETAAFKPLGEQAHALTVVPEK